ncbi:hypothetical protein [Flavobacterium ginsengiterrae]|uniref:Lipoprotein n=1 Tax=Flavobacterium ginsengiterrae TaxID=871695 RepID=A0ABP7GR66_9FLAO
MKKYYIFIITLIYATLSCTSESKPTKKELYLKSLLKENKIDIDNYSLINHKDIEYYIKGFTITDSRDSLQLQKIKVADNVYFNTYEYTPSDYKKFHSDFFTIKGTKISVDEIVKQNNVELKYFNPYFYISKSYLFKNPKNKESIFLLEALNRTHYMNKEVVSYFLIKNTSKPTVILLYDTF